MIKRLALTVLMTFLVSPLPVAAQATQQSVSNVHNNYDLAVELVTLTYPAERARNDSLDQFEKQFRRSFNSNPDNMKLADKYPGLLDALVSAGRTELRTILETELETKMISNLASRLSTQLSRDELTLLRDFYRSPAGQALQRLDPRTIDPSTGMLPIDDLSLEHRIAIGRFQDSLIGKRSGAILRSMFADAAQQSEQIMRPYLPRLQNVIRTTTRDFINRQTSS